MNILSGLKNVTLYHVYNYWKLMYVFSFVVLWFLVSCNSAFAVEKVTIDELVVHAIDENYAINDVDAEIDIQYNALRDAIALVSNGENQGGFDKIFEFDCGKDFFEEMSLLNSVTDEHRKWLSLLEEKNFWEFDIEATVRDAYFDVLLGQYSVCSLEDQLEVMQVLCEEYDKKYKIGACDQGDYRYTVDSLDRLNGELSDAKLNFDLRVDDLEKAVGFEISSDVEFVDCDFDFDVNSIIWHDVYVFAAENQYEFVSTLEDVDVAQAEFDDLMSIFDSKYADFLNELTLLCESSDGEIISEEEFNALHEYTMMNTEDFWSKDYVLDTGIFCVTIPREYLSENNDDVAVWLDGKKSELYELYVKLEEAKKVASVAGGKLNEDVESTYNHLLQVFSECEFAEEKFTYAKLDYENSANGQKMGDVAFLDLEVKRNYMIAAELNLYTKNNEFFGLCNEFNELTGGYISNYCGNLYNNNLPFMQYLPSQGWYLVVDNVNDSFEFSCNISKSYAVDEYQLAYNGVALGDKISIGEIWEQDAISYNGTTNVDVYMYENGAVKYKSTVDLLDFYGEMSINFADDVPQIKSPEVGFWYLKSSNMLCSVLAIDMIDCNFMQYEVLINGKHCCVVNKGDDLFLPRFFLSDVFDTEIVLYDNSGFMYSLSLDNGVTKGHLLRVD